MAESPMEAGRQGRLQVGANDEQEGLGCGSAPLSLTSFECVQYILRRAKVKGANTAKNGEDLNARKNY